MRPSSSTSSNSVTVPISTGRRYHEKPVDPRPVKTVHPRPLKPSISPPSSCLSHPPALPECAKARLEAIAIDHRRRSDDLDEICNFFDVSTHIMPAAYPRLTPFVSFTELERKAGGFPGNETKKSRIQRSACISEKLLQLRNEWSDGSLALDGSENRVLWNVVNRYVRKSSVDTGSTPNRKTVTLLLTHATGLHKETWEPFLVQLYGELEGRDVLVDEAWAIEAVQHGDSFLINEEKIGVLFDWSEHGRDILNFLLNYLPDKSSSSSSLDSRRRLPVHLTRIPEDVSRMRVTSGFRDRTLVAVGHSFGGCSSVLAAVNAPSLLSGLILVDPVIVPEFKDRTQQVLFYAGISLQRQERWASRDEALKLFKRSPVLAAWHPKVIESYLRHGLIYVHEDKENSKGDKKDKDMRVKLKMPGLQEAVTFVDIQTSYEAYELLEVLDDGVELLWVLASTNSGLLSPEEEQWQVWRRPAKCENVCVKSGHLIVQEAPDQLAQEVSAFVCAKFATKKSVVDKYKL